MLSLDYEISRVYAHWLRYLAKGPNWGKMSHNDHEKTAERLADAIKREASNDLAGVDWEPTEILREVGYERSWL